MDEILTSIKKLLGIVEEYTQFDDDIIMHINTTFMTLQQIGVGPSNGYLITKDGHETWTDYLGDDLSNLQAVKSYIYLNVKLLFDPPTTASYVLESIKEQIKELTWRLNVQVDPRME